MSKWTSPIAKSSARHLGSQPLHIAYQSFSSFMHDLTRFRILSFHVQCIQRLGPLYIGLPFSLGQFPRRPMLVTQLSIFFVQI